MKADALLEAGDINGQATWKRILAAVEELLLEERQGALEGNNRGLLCPRKWTSRPNTQNG